MNAKTKIYQQKLIRHWRQQVAMLGVGRLARLGLVLLFVLALFVPTVQQLALQKQYQLDASTIRLVGSTNKNLRDKFSYDASNAQWQFNREGLAPDTSSLPGGAGALAALKAQVGGDGDKDASLYSVNLPVKGDQGITYYDNNTNLSFSVVPEFKVSDGQKHNGQLVYPFQNGGKLIYTAKNNGMKEDIVLSHNIGDSLQFSYKLNLPDTLVARIQQDGSVGIFSADPVLFGNIQFGSNADEAKIESARKTADKDHLLFAIPAPLIKQTGANNMPATARFSLEGSELKVYATGMSQLTYPVTVDPSVVVTSTSDFSSGNNEGNINYVSGQTNRGALTGGSTGSWTATTGFSGGISSLSSAAYNGYMYTLGGLDSGGTPLNTVNMAPINSDGTLGSWTATTGFGAGVSGLSTVVYNGYMYVLGGYDGSNNVATVKYAKINADGTLGSWTATTSLPVAASSMVATVYNGNMYILGGSGSSLIATVKYAKINADGTLGSWTATTSLGTGTYGAAGFAYNGNMYILGGLTSSGSYSSSVQYAPINEDGTLGTWLTTTGFSTGRVFHTATVYNGYVYVAGGENSSGAVLGDTQYAPLNANGALGNWNATSSLATTRMYSAMASYNGYLYMLCGQTSAGTKLSDVRYSKIDPAGTISGYTANSTQMSTNTSNGAALAYNNYLYVLGGFGGGSYLSNVRYAPINADGSVGNWTESSNALLAPTGTGVGLLNNGYVYVLGGQTTGGVRQALVQYASLNSDGSLNAFAATTALPATLAAGTGAVYNGYMYYMGGQNGTRKKDVYYAPINTDGTIGSWAVTSSLNRIKQTALSVVWNGYLYSIGGCNTKDSLGVYSAAEYAKINADGTLGSWTDTTSMQTARLNISGFVSGGYVYAIGGNDGTNDLATAEYAKINADGTLASWQYTTPLPDTYTNYNAVYYGGRFYMYGGQMGTPYIKSGLIAEVNNGGTGMTENFNTNSTSLSAIMSGGWGYGQTFAANGYLYMVGGRNAGTTYATVYAAPIGDDGSLGSWAATSSLNMARNSFGLAIQNGYVYVAGGETGGTSVNSVEYAVIETDGTLGTWQSGGTLSNARTLTAATAYNGYLYVLGGTNVGTYYNDVQYASLNPSTGAVGSWGTTTAFPTARSSLQAVAYGGYIYVLGGRVTSTFLSDVQYAPLNSDGTVGTWAATASMNLARANFAVAASNGYIYTYGGENSAGNLADVQSAQFGANGQINNWKRAGLFTNARYGLAGSISNGKLYVVGGYTPAGGYFNDVQYSLLDVQARVAVYSKLVDLGQEYGVSTISYNGNLPGGMSAITYRAAGDDGILGSVQHFGQTTAATACTAGSGSGFVAQYVWLSVTLDGSGGSIYPDSGSNFANVTDLTVSYGPLHAQPNQRLFGGKYFKDEALQPLDTCGA